MGRQNAPPPARVVLSQQQHPARHAALCVPALQRATAAEGRRLAAAVSREGRGAAARAARHKGGRGGEQRGGEGGVSDDDTEDGW